jgi:hypothetical protein
MNISLTSLSSLLTPKIDESEIFEERERQRAENHYQREMAGCGLKVDLSLYLSLYLIKY